MPHETPLIAAIVAGIVLAFVMGALAHRLRISPLVGYLLAGVIVGPFTPGFVADQALVGQLAEIGVILLMFGVGLHFSLRDLLSVRAIAVPGAICQIAVATCLGWGLGALIGWPTRSGIVFGLALSVASTVVLLRAMQERRLISSNVGRIAVGWLIIEDLFMVTTLVMLPPIAELLAAVDSSGGASSLELRDITLTLAWTLGKVAVFVAVMLIAGRRVVPWLLHVVAHTGSRELFRLAVLSIALGIAFGAATLFGVSFALGAFFAGMILSESELSHQAAEESLPLRDAFAVLFFVSVGMLLDPAILLGQFWLLLGTLLIILVGKSAAAFAIVRLFGHPRETAFIISASLAQIGEFSFILAGLGVGLGLLPEQGQDIILAGAIVSILLNPLSFFAVDRWQRRAADSRAKQGSDTSESSAPASTAQVTTLAGHCVVIGFGRVGRVIGAALGERHTPFYVIELKGEIVSALVTDGVAAIEGNAADPDILATANLAEARCLFVAVPDAFEAGQIIGQARAINPALEIVARAHSDMELERFKRLGASQSIFAEQELADAMIRTASLTPAMPGEPAAGEIESSV